MGSGKIYKIKRNTWTGTYYVYNRSRPVQLRKDKTKSMKQFMESHNYTKVYEFEVWR